MKHNVAQVNATNVYFLKFNNAEKMLFLNLFTEFV